MAVVAGAPVAVSQPVYGAPPLSSTRWRPGATLAAVAFTTATTRALAVSVAVDDCELFPQPTVTTRSAIAVPIQARAIAAPRLVRGHIGVGATHDARHVEQGE